MDIPYILITIPITVAVAALSAIVTNSVKEDNVHRIQAPQMSHCATALKFIPTAIRSIAVAVESFVTMAINVLMGNVMIIH